ncbi:hypothetical protein [Saccharopolyspora shandongensis]|uniref:hypothetical protein n=1 Tax=Saccharopolyspora shandongensis TaxID=418495 RepID=UPI0033F41CA2
MAIEIGRGEFDAKVVLDKPDVDIAILAVPDLDADAMTFVPGAPHPVGLSVRRGHLSFSGGGSNLSSPSSPKVQAAAGVPWWWKICH